MAWQGVLSRVSGISREMKERIKARLFELCDAWCRAARKTSTRFRALRPRSERPGAPWSAFTLVEILAAMAILVVVVLGLSRAFNDAAAVFRRGSTMVERNAAVQVVFERIAKDLEAIVINPRIALYQESNVVAPDIAGYDQMFFVTTARDVVEGTTTMTSGDREALYHFVRYWVAPITNTFAGIPYVSYSLKRSTWMRDLLHFHGVDPCATNCADRDWWYRVVTDSGSERITADTETLLDHVVRFDIYVHNENGELVTRWVGNRGYFDTRKTKLPEYPVADVVPACIDIYIQVTSPEAARRAGMILAKNPSTDLKNEAVAQLYRESNVMILRVFPMMKAYQWLGYPETWDGGPLKLKHDDCD